MKKCFKLFAVSLMMLATFAPAQAVELTVAQGTDQAEYVPFYGMYMDTRGTVSQVIYPADMLADMQGGTISAIKFYPTEALKAYGEARLQVALMEVEQDRFTATETIEGATVVVSEYAIEAEATELVIEFDTPFVYNGGNLMIETTLTTAGNMKSAKFNGVANNYAVGLAQYTYAWSDTYYYETENVLPMATFTYEAGGGEQEAITLLSQANALEDNAEFTFDGDAVVTVFKNGYLFLRDESGYGMISGVTGEFENGQVLSQGWNATKTSVSDTWVRYTDAAGLSASGETNAELAAAQKLTSAPDESMLNAYVYIENALPNSSGVPMLPQRYFTLEDNSKLYVSDILWASSWDADGNYNFYGVLCKERGQVRINVVGFEPYVPQPEGLRGDVNDDTNVNVADVAALINYLLTQDPSGVNLDNADCTLDEQVNVADIAALINYLLTQTW